MSQLDLARIQFALDEHLPLPVRAGHDRPGVPRRDPAHAVVPLAATRSYRRLTRFFGTLLLINVAVGVVTGLVQEFQFGMNWSAYSRFVGDVFGAPLAMEGLAAFFLESTFLGLWVFGWNVLPPRRAPGRRLGGRGRRAACRRCSSWRPTRGCSTRSATPQPDHRPAAADVDRRRCSPTRCSSGATCTCSLAVAGHRRRGDARGVGLAPAPRQRRRRCSTGRAKLALVVLLLADACCSSQVGSQLGMIETTLPADEDRRGGGAVGRPASRARSPSFQIGGWQPRTRPRRRSSRSRTCCRSWPPAPGTARCTG